MMDSFFPSFENIRAAIKSEARVTGECSTTARPGCIPAESTKNNKDKSMLTNSEKAALSQQWAKLWPSDKANIEAAVACIAEGEARDRATYNMAMRTQPAPQQYWGKL